MTEDVDAAAETEAGDEEMLASVVSAADVARRLLELRERFGEFPVREERRENDPEFFAEGLRLVRDGWRGDAGALVTDADGHVLLVRHADAPDVWGTPGGGHEPDESFVETARRECREETGVDPAITDVHEAVRREVFHATDPDRSFTMLTVHFEGEVNAAELSLESGEDDEILEARWFEHPPDRFHEHCREWVRETLATDETAREDA